MPRLAERLNCSLQLRKAKEYKKKFIITAEIIIEIRKNIDVLEKCCQLALKQPLPEK